MSKKVITIDDKVYAFYPIEVENYDTCENCAGNLVESNDLCDTLHNHGCSRGIYKEVSNTDEYLLTGKVGGKVVNNAGGVKNDGGKVRPTLLVKSMPKAVKEVMEVLQHGADKYGADNWKLVENERYDDALLRHLLLGYFSGERKDPDSGKSHLAHVACCVLFLLEKELEN